MLAASLSSSHWHQINLTAAALNQARRFNRQTTDLSSARRPDAQGQRYERGIHRAHRSMNCLAVRHSETWHRARCLQSKHRQLKVAQCSAGLAARSQPQLSGHESSSPRQRRELPAQQREHDKHQLSVPEQLCSSFTRGWVSVTSIEKKKKI